MLRPHWPWGSCPFKGFDDEVSKGWRGILCFDNCKGGLSTSALWDGVHKSSGMLHASQANPPGHTRRALVNEPS